MYYSCKVSETEQDDDACREAPGFHRRSFLMRTPCVPAPQLHVPSWVPGIVIGYLTKKAIKEANAWVKRESELKYQRDLSSGRMLRSRRATTPLPTMPSLGGFGGRRARQEAILAAEEAARKEVERLEAATALAKERAQRIRGMISSGVKSAVSVGAGYGMCWWLQVRAKGPRGAAAA